MRKLGVMGELYLASAGIVLAAILLYVLFKGVLGLFK